MFRKYIFTLFQPPFFNISDTDVPASLALLDEADLQLYALNTEVSTPAFESCLYPSRYCV